MKKFIRNITIFILIISSTLLVSNLLVYASENIPEKLRINTSSESAGHVYDKYNKFSASIINSEAGIGYCLEIDKDYPEGQVFKLKGDCTQGVRNLLLAGYPNKSASELGVNSNEDAYLATQIAIWALTDGYDINSFQSEKQGVIDAIRNIYSHKEITLKEEFKYDAKEYFAQESTQDIVMLFKTKVGGATLPQTGGASSLALGLSGLVSVALGGYLVFKRK